nr:hypothetical protein CFP56_64084 [Quercus suber]
MGLTFALRNRHVLAKAKRRHHVFDPKSLNFCTFSHSQSQTSTKQNEDTVNEISAMLKQMNWQCLIESSDIPKKLNPEVVRSVLLQNKWRFRANGDDPEASFGNS